MIFSVFKKIGFWSILCPTKYGGNRASRWIRDLWFKGVSLILSYFQTFLSFCVFGDFLRFYKNKGFWVFLVHPPMASVLLSASVERCFVSRMRDFLFTHKLHIVNISGLYLVFPKLCDIFQVWIPSISGKFPQSGCSRPATGLSYLCHLSCRISCSHLFLECPVTTTSKVHLT